MQQLFVILFVLLASVSATHRHPTVPDDFETMPMPIPDSDPELVALIEKLGRPRDRDERTTPVHPVETVKIPSEEAGKRFLRKHCRGGCKLPKQRIQAHRLGRGCKGGRCGGRDYRKMAASERAGLQAVKQAHDRTLHHTKGRGRGEEDEGGIIIRPVHEQEGQKQGDKDKKKIRREIVVVRRKGGKKGKGDGKGKDHPCFEVNQINLHVDVDVKQAQKQQNKQAIVQVGKIEHHGHRGGHHVHKPDHGDERRKHHQRRHHVTAVRPEAGNKVYGHGHQRGHGYVRHPTRRPGRRPARRTHQNVEMMASRRPQPRDEEEIPRDLEPSPPSDSPNWRDRLDRLRRRLEDALERVRRDLDQPDTPAMHAQGEVPKHRTSPKWTRQIRKRIHKWRKHFAKESFGTKLALLLSLTAIITMQIAMISKLVEMARGAYERVPGEDKDCVWEKRCNYEHRHGITSAAVEEC